MHPRAARALAVQDLILRHPEVQSASFVKSHDSQVSVKLRLSTTSFKTNSKREYTQCLLLSEGDDSVNVVETPMEAASEEVKMSTGLHQDTWTVNFRVHEGKKRVIEILHSASGIYDEIDVTDVHADFLGGPQYGEPVWLGDERILVYAAEQHAPNWKDDNKPYTAYYHAPNLGETFNANVRPGLFLLDFSNSGNTKVSPIAPNNLDISQGVYFRQATLAPLGSRLLPDGRRLGAIWCDNRPDNIYEIAIVADGTKVEAVSITSDERSARLPRVLQYGGQTVLVYFTKQRGYEHGGCATMHKRSLPLDKSESGSNDILVDVVRNPTSPDEFPGLYPQYVAADCLVNIKESDKIRTCIVLASTWRCRITIVTVDLEDGTVKNQGTDEMTSFTHLATDTAGRILAVRSTMITPPELVLGTFNNGKSRAEWKAIKSWPYEFKKGEHFEGLSTLYSTIVPLPGWGCTEAIVVSAFPLDQIPGLPRKVFSAKILDEDVTLSPNARLPPAIHNPHGGPSDAETSFWRAEGCISLIAAGYTCVFPNFPGSIGYGQDFTESMAKDDSGLDVLGTLEMKRYLVKLGVISDEKGKRFISGHSHGGFIGAHLSVRWSDEFDAVKLGNPVIDLPSNFATSDIPDWSLEQFGVKYDFNNPPSYLEDEDYHKLRKLSPTYHALQKFAKTKERCVTPTQLVIGSDDVRVPTNQGINWYHCLKGHGEEVELLVFPGNGHPIDKVWTYEKTLQARVEFFVKYSVFD